MDEEAKQMLRELVALHREQAERARSSHDRYTADSEAYAKSLAEDYRGSAEYRRAQSVAVVIRAISALGIVAVIAYLAIFGMHTH